MDKQALALAVEQLRQKRQAKGAQVLAELPSYHQQVYTEFLRQRARQWPERTALIYKEQRYTYQALFEKIDACAAGLHQHGVRAGQAVAILLDNSDAYIITHLAVLSLAAIAVPVNTKLVAPEVAYIVDNSKSVMAVSAPAFAGLWAQVTGTLAGPLPVLDAQALQGEGATASARAHDGRIADHDSPAAIYYTSGTTGRPKGVVHTHRSLTADALQNPSTWEYDFDGLVALAVTPMFHIATNAIFLPVLALGGTLIIESYRTEDTLAALQRGEVNSFLAVPSMLLMMVEKAQELGITLPAVRSLQFGAAPMPMQRLAEVQKLFPNAGLIHGMGQTESCGVLTTLPSALAFACAGSVGIAMAGVEVGFVDLQDQPLGPREVGELVGRGPNVMKEYFDNPSASEQTLRGGWLHTGDMGYRDELGLCYLVDRKKDMIIRGGENIYSIEVEQALLGHPAIAQAAVIGKPDKMFGEQVCAFVVPKDAHAAPSVESMVEHCRLHLASYKIPVDWRLMDQLPATATGKIQKAELRKLL